MDSEKAQMWKSRKIRSASLDTDVISDVLYREILSRKGGLSFVERFKLLRAEQSFRILNLLFGVRVELVGSIVVREELRAKSKYLVDLFDKTFDKTTDLDKKIKNLGRKYEQKTAIKPADALILADLSVHHVDCLISWNRKHMVSTENYATISKINKYAGVSTPMPFTPKEFLERVSLEPRTNIIWVSREAIPHKFLPRSFPSKQTL